MANRKGNVAAMHTPEARAKAARTRRKNHLAKMRALKRRPAKRVGRRYREIEAARRFADQFNGSPPVLRAGTPNLGIHVSKDGRTLGLRLAGLAVTITVDE